MATRNNCSDLRTGDIPSTAGGWERQEMPHISSETESG